MGAKTCLGVGVLIALLFVVVTAIEALIIQLAWNFVVVDTLGADLNHLGFKAALVTAVALNVIGSAFKTTVTTRE